MARLPKRASSSAAITSWRPRISIPQSRSRRGFRRRASARSRCGRSGSTTSEGAVAHRHMTLSEIDKIFRDEAGRALATLIRLVGDFDLAEDALQDAFAAAMASWRAGELPSNPRAWLVNVGRNKAIDRVRRQVAFRSRQQQVAQDVALNAAAAVGEVADPAELDDDMLRLIFVCCHPSFAPEVQVALTLRTVCGLTTEQGARAFLVGEAAMAQRLVRAKQKIRLAGIPYEVPGREALEARLNGVLAVIYQVFTEGYVATSGDELMRPDLAREAIRLG